MQVLQTIFDVLKNYHAMLKWLEESLQSMPNSCPSSSQVNNLLASSVVMKLRVSDTLLNKDLSYV